MLLDKLNSKDQTAWYIQKTIENSWSRSVLVQQIESKLYERQAGVKKLSNFEQTLPKPLSSLAQGIMKDSYNFTFLGLSSSAPEREIEVSLEQKVSKLLLEMGSGFSYMGRQYPLKVGEQSFAIDMLFYNVKLRCYCAIELKAKDFKPADVGQLNFYLTVMDEQLKQPEDNSSIGLLICPEKDKLVAEYALRNIQNPMGISAFQLSEVLPDALKTGVTA